MTSTQVARIVLREYACPHSIGSAQSIADFEWIIMVFILIANA